MAELPRLRRRQALAAGASAGLGAPTQPRPATSCQAKTQTTGRMTPNGQRQAPAGRAAAASRPETAEADSTPC